MAVTAADVHQIQFERAPLGTRGYHEPEVDTFLKRIAATLEGADKVTAVDVHRIAFGRAPLGKRGYDATTVDAFLRRVESTLASHPTIGVNSTYIAPALEHTHARQPLWRRIRKTP